MEEEKKRYSSREMRRFSYLVGETEALYHALARRLGLSDSALGLLFVLCDEGGACPLQLALRHSGLSKQTANSALRRLEAEGVVYLEPLGARGKRVCLTEAGRALAEATVARVMAAENAVLAAWSAEDVDAYLRLTERYLVDLREKTKDLRKE